MDTTIMVGIASALVAGSLPLLLTHILARGDRAATAEQRFQANVVTAHQHCQDELTVTQRERDEWREKYFTERDQRQIAGAETAEATEVKPLPPGGG